MRHFFIDLENVRSYGLEGVLLLQPEDMVYVFYSDNANTLTIPTIESLNESPATVKYIKTNYTGANAMDFQIVTLLGATIERDKSGSFYIISHDNGFKSAVKFCEGYFTSYDIETGVFANIILAINSEKGTKGGSDNSVGAGANAKAAGERKSNRRNRHHKKSNQSDNTESKEAVHSEDTISNNNEDVNNSLEQTNDEQTVKEQAENNKKSRSRRRGKNNRYRNEKTASKITATEEVTDSKQDTTVIVPDDALNLAETNEASANVAQDSNDAKNGSDAKTSSKRRRHRGSRNKSVNKSEAVQETEVTAQSPDNMIQSDNKDKADAEQKVKKSKKPDSKKASKTDYLYKTLSDYLSESTIDMYATVIDEGVRVSNTKDDLHSYFKKKYDSDEAEALYKIIGSDFSELKKQSRR